jgi:hypothetical protein
MIPVEVLRVMWAATGSLYASNMERSMEDDIREAIERTDGPFRPDVGTLTPDAMPAAADPGDRLVPGGATLQEIANEMGISRERVRQIQARAMRKMRRQFVIMFGRPFPEKTTAERLVDATRPATYRRPSASVTPVEYGFLPMAAE